MKQIINIKSIILNKTSQHEWLILFDSVCKNPSDRKIDH